MLMDANTTIKARKKVVSQILDDETILLDTVNGIYFGLNQTGTLIWSLIQECTTLGEIYQTICRKFEIDEETAWKDLLEIVNSLQKKNLIEI